MHFSKEFYKIAEEQIKPLRTIATVGPSTAGFAEFNQKIEALAANKRVPLLKDTSKKIPSLDILGNSYNSVWVRGDDFEASHYQRVRYSVKVRHNFPLTLKFTGDLALSDLNTRRISLVGEPEYSFSSSEVTRASYLDISVFGEKSYNSTRDFYQICQEAYQAIFGKPSSPVITLDGQFMRLSLDLDSLLGQRVNINNHGILLNKGQRFDLVITEDEWHTYQKTNPISATPVT
jgi:hypothetical protein